MPLTPEEESRLAFLQSKYAPASTTAPATPPLEGGILSRIGGRVANFIPGAAEKLVGGMTGLMNLTVPDTAEDRLPGVSIPRPVDLAPAQTWGQKAVDVVGELGEFLPSMAVPEIGAAGILSKVGMAPKAARILASGIGMALPTSQQGAESMVMQGGANAAQTAASELGMGVRGRLAMGLLAGGIGAYEGAKTSGQDALIQGGLNLLGPTLIDPALRHIMGAKDAATAAGKASEASAPLPNQGNDIAAGAFEKMNAAQKTAHVEALSGIFPTPPDPMTPRGGMFGEIPNIERTTAGQFATGTELALPRETIQPVFPQPIAGQRATMEEFMQSEQRKVAALQLSQGMLPAPEGRPALGFSAREPEPPAPVAALQLQDRPPVAEASPTILPSGPTIVTPPPKVPKVPKALLEPHTKLPSGLLKHLDESVGWTGPEEPLPSNFTQNAFDLGKKMKTPKDVERLRKAADLYGSASQHMLKIADSMDPNDFDTLDPVLQKGMHFSSRQQYFTEAAEYAEGHPDKAQLFIDRDPDYKPSVPGQGWKDWASGKVSAPEVGTASVVWTNDFPEVVRVTRSEGDMVHYEQHNHETGQIEQKFASAQEFAQMQKTPAQKKSAQEQIKEEANPSEPVEPAPAEPESKVAGLQQSVDRVRVRGRFGLEDAVIVGREGDTLHVEIQDPIFGSRRASVLASDALPHKVESAHTPRDRSIPFADIESAKLTGREGVKGVAQKGENETDLLGSVLEGTGPANIRKTIPGKGKTVLSVLEGLRKLPPEAAHVIGEILHQLQVAAKQDIDLVLAQKMHGMKGGMYEGSGKVALNLQWIGALVSKWDTRSQVYKDKAMMRVSMLFAHEITHIAQKFGEKSNLSIGGKPLISAIMEKVDSMSPSQRMYVAEQIHKAKGDPATEMSLKYLSGDYDTIFKVYSAQRPGLTKAQAVELAAGEFMAELGAVELTKRMNVSNLPETLRNAIDNLKSVVVRVVDWFRGNNEMKAVAAMQDLQDMASKMYDHFAAGDKTALNKAFPASSHWAVPPPVNPFTTGHLPPTTPPTPPVTVVAGPFMQRELARLGVRAVVGGAAGGIIAPNISDHQVSTAEGILIGGVLGSFGPAVAKLLLSKQLPEEIAAAARLHKNPIKAFAHIMGNGKSLRDLGLEGRFGWAGDGTFSAKAVRFLETHFNVNLDPKLKALIEEGRGAGQVILATVQNALEKARWFKPNASLQQATEEYFLGKISKDQFKALLGSDVDQQYGHFIITAREATTTLSKMFASGMPPGTFTKHVIDSAEAYLGRFYTAYKEGKFDMAHFEAAKKDMMSRIPGLNDIDADNIMREHMREVQANRSIFGGRRGNSGQKVDASLTFRRLATEEEIEAQRIIVAGEEHNPHGPDYQREKAKLDWMEAHPISDNWRAWLGEYKNPVDRMLMTFQKLYPSAISAKIYDMLDNRVGSTGLKFAMTQTELRQTRELLEHTLSKETDPAKVAALQHDIKELSGYVPLPSGSAYGKLQNKYVDRFVRDEISTYATPFKWMEQPILRGIASVNNLIKLERTALNPLTTIRNYIQAPLFGLIAKTNTGDVMAAWKEVRHTRGADYELMLKRHIIGVDYVAAELTSNPGAIFSGYMDSDIAMKVLKHGVDKAVEFYQHPDVMIRAGSFISARKRFAQELAERTGLSFNDALKHETVIDKAVEFTNRYTMNYATVPRVIKAGRQLPFVSLFISYTSEITRILKNLTQDAINPHADSAGRMHAVTTLAAMAAIPPILVATFEGNLSEKDRQDWEKVKALSPSYNRSRFRLPTGRDARGNFRYMDMTNLIPADSYTQMMKAFASGDMEGAAAANPILSLQNTPLLNIAVEQVAGKDLRTDKDIKGVRGRISEILKETVPPWLPPGYEGQRLQRAFSPNAEGTLGTVNTRTGAEVRPSDIIANYMTGMRFGNVSLTTLQKGAIAEAQHALAEEKSAMQQVLRTNLSEQEKGHAQAHYHRMQQEILLALHSRLDLKQAQAHASN